MTASGEMRMHRPRRWFFPGRSLPEELRAAMNRLGRYGVTYPDGYHEHLVRKYAGEGISYPHILIILGIPRINHHSCYPRILREPVRLLDYGCGTGDNVRQLLRDGYPRKQITAFDIGRESVELGFDLYRDRAQMADLFVISETFPFGTAEFDAVYSASVIHVIRDDHECSAYLAHACSVLREGGIFFGTTLGLKERTAVSRRTRGPPRILMPEQLAASLTSAGFKEISIVKREGVPAYVPGSGELCVLEFITRKPA